MFKKISTEGKNIEFSKKKHEYFWQNLANYFKTCWFLWKVVLSENAKIFNEKVFNFKQKYAENLTRNIFQKIKQFCFVIDNPLSSNFSFKMIKI